MSINRRGMRADKYVVANGGMIKGSGRPVLINTPRGQVVEKDVEHFTMTCPECGAVGRHDDRGEIICEDDECGCVISGEAPVSYEEYGQQTHNEAATMGNSVGQGSASKPAPTPASQGADVAE